MSKFTFIDLFSGIGGFHLALKNAGGECLNFSEIAKDAIDYYCENYNEPYDKNLSDITKLTVLPKCDILTAGVPCQSWSIAGKNLGFEDDRGQLWNDTLFLLNQSKPKAFIFENVKGLTDPRNKIAFEYILERIKEAGYYAAPYVLSASDYGVPQNRIRVYIIGFENEEDFNKFKLPRKKKPDYIYKYLDDELSISFSEKDISYYNDLPFNDYFLFNDLRGGDTTIHSWDLIETTNKQKMICDILLKNRRKKIYGPLDGNPLSLKLFQSLDENINQTDLDQLVELNILKPENYHFIIDKSSDKTNLSSEEIFFLNSIKEDDFIIDNIKNKKEYKIEKIKPEDLISKLLTSGNIICDEIRYDFKNTKISTGLNGINRIILPHARTFPTLVASDSNDFIATKMIKGDTIEEYRYNFMHEIYFKGNYRKITKSEACRIQGFPEDFILPEKRNRWMKLIGNSVSVPVIEQLFYNIYNLLNKEK